MIAAGAGNPPGKVRYCRSAPKSRLSLGRRPWQKHVELFDAPRRDDCNIEILYRTEIRKMRGGKMLEAVELENVESGERRMVETPAVFSMIGAKPCTNWLPSEIACDEKGFIKTGAAVADAPAWQKSKRAPGPLETSVPGIFAAGDVRSGSVKRCAAAVGEGGMAIAGVHAALEDSPND